MNGLPNDTRVASTLMRWGNYDVVNNGVRWSASEVPSTLSQYANPVPANQNLPTSFYLSAKPGWWGTMPWPAVGPDVTGGSDTSGHAYANPAQVCYNTASIDSKYGSANVRTFNANTCYGGQTGPPPPKPVPPTNLSAVVH